MSAVLLPMLHDEHLKKDHPYLHGCMAGLLSLKSVCSGLTLALRRLGASPIPQKGCYAPERKGRQLWARAHRHTPPGVLRRKHVGARPAKDS
jgi:hypothetical protein